LGVLAGCGGSVSLPFGPVPHYAEPVPAPVQTALRFDRLGIGAWHTCMLTAPGAAWCWGSNEYGQLGAVSAARCMDDTIDCSAVPLAVTGPADYTRLAASLRFTCALTLAGGARCWGFGQGGQLGDGQRTDSLVPVDVAGGHAFVGLVASLTEGVTCGLKADGSPWCWGIGFSSAAGPAASPVPAPWTAAAGVVWRELSLGEAHACGLDTAGRAWCLGRNSFGELGDGTDLSAATPVPVAGNHVFQSITVGAMHSCGLDVAGQAWCWGLGRAVGDGTEGSLPRRIPVAVVGGLQFVELTAGSLRTCGRSADGQAWCWGDGGTGALGDGTREDRPAPVQVIGGESYAALAAGGMATCGLLATGQAWCWGWNETGALGRPIVAHD
jgi:alpha-tubulin suppressor-like RCC1 family protein